MTAEKVLFALLRAAVCQNMPDAQIASLCKPDVLADLYALAHKHDLAHLAGHALEKLSLPESEAQAKLRTAKKQAIYRYIRLDHESQRIYDVLADTEIDFMPLKGAVLRGYYPESWMRTSCDIDVMIPESQLEKAKSVLVEKLGYTYKGKNDHDLSLFSPNGLHLELHYMAVDKGRFEKAQNVLKRMWEDASGTESCTYHRVLSDEMFYFYHIAHMAKHIENGGCGIRPFLDLWILNQKLQFDPEKRRDLLTEGGLLPFAEAVEKMAEIWFTSREMDAMSRQLEQYVLRGGTYGALENRISIDQTKLGGKGRYALRKIFLPYDTLKYQYPVLQKYRILTPVFEVVRWLKLLFKGGIKRSVNNLKMNVAVSTEVQEQTGSLMSYLGLQ